MQCTAVPQPTKDGSGVAQPSSSSSLGGRVLSSVGSATVGVGSRVSPSSIGGLLRATLAGMTGARVYSKGSIRFGSGLCKVLFQ